MEQTTQRSEPISPPEIKGTIRTDSLTRQLYSTDASIYEIKPEYVLFPLDADDIATIHRWAENRSVTLIPRGSGTSLSGQSIGRGAVVDYSKHFNEILGYNENRGTVRVEPGVVLDHLNDHLAEFDRHFGPDVATSNRATIGGMIGNNSAGAHSIRYGYTAQHVESLRCVLPNGEEVTFEALSREQAREKARGNGLEAKLYETIPDMVRNHADLIDDQYPDILRNVSGYGLDRFLDKLREDVVDFTELICGSEGTLGAVVEARLETVPAITDKSMVIVNCDSLQEAVRANRRVVRESPLAVELLDRTLLDLAADSREISRYMDWTQGEPEAILIVEVGAEKGGPSLSDRKRSIRRALDDSGDDLDVNEIAEESTREHVWKVRKSGLPLLLGISDDRKPTTFVEDTAVEPDHLADYVSEFQDLVEDYGTTAAFYGHISVGCLHIRPLINLKTTEGVEDMKAMTADVVNLVKKYNGSLSGEHGDGRARSEWLDDFYSPEMTELYDRVKTTFDPEHRMNPGNVVDPESMTDNLRFGPDYDVDHWDLEQDFTEDRGFSDIIERCNGSAVCRKEDSGTMCPSYMVTRDETHSTRGRANALRGLIAGNLDADALTDGRIEEIMDLCISCKACKSECPSEVDMAPLKQEVTHQIHQENGAGFRERFFAGFGWMARTLEAFQPVAGWFQRVPGVSYLVGLLLSVAPERTLPRLATDPVTRNDTPRDIDDSTDNVVLYPDTFTGYVRPDLFRQAESLLEKLDLNVIVPDTPCCGRTYLSQGFLDRARDQAQKTVETLAPYARKGVPILILEPSCYSALVDDYGRLLENETLRSVRDKTELLSDYLNEQHSETVRDRRAEGPGSSTIWVHGHCHQKALVGEQSLVELFSSISKDSVEFVDGGCCGMAGSFGYEREHYEHSVAMANRKLTPALERSEAEDRVVAPGFSCREQIRDLTSVTPEHPVEVLNDLIHPRNGS